MEYCCYWCYCVMVFEFNIDFVEVQCLHEPAFSWNSKKQRFLARKYKILSCPIHSSQRPLGRHLKSHLLLCLTFSNQSIPQALFLLAPNFYCCFTVQRIKLKLSIDELFEASIQFLFHHQNTACRFCLPRWLLHYCAAFPVFYELIPLRWIC